MTIVLLLLFLLSSCKGAQYIPIHSHTTDSVKTISVCVDSVYRYDSVYVREYGETLYVDRVRYLYKAQIKTDTLQILRVDTISRPYPVEKSLNRWAKFKVDYGGLAMLVVLVLLMILTKGILFLR